MRILVCGGGTFGHVWPVILVAKELQENNKGVLFIGSRIKLEKATIETQNIKFKSIFAGKKRAYFSILNYFDILKTFIGIIQSFFIIIKFRPDVIFAKGGYVTYPIIFWLSFLKIPLVIHESDAILGQANLIASKYAKKICLGFPIEYYTQSLESQKCIYTGTPVREKFILEDGSINDKSILILGGTQGSKIINDTILEILPELTKIAKVEHVTGSLGYEFFKSKNFENYFPSNFRDDLGELMKKSTIIVSRAGASALSEISACGKPSIIIPLKTSKNNHQLVNANIYKNNHAAILISEDELTPELLISKLKSLFEDENLRKNLEENVKKFYIKDSVEKITRIINEESR